ncbi:S1 family peptidase, partial [Singulisphaera rosea]
AAGEDNGDGDGDGDSEANGEDVQAEEEEPATAEEVVDTEPRNPFPWETVVRIKIQGNGMIGFGSGTIIHSTAEESIILTCAHIFKMEGQRPVPPSKFPLGIAIDLFDGKLDGPNHQQVHRIETVDGQAIDYDFARDVGLIRIRPGRRLAASRVGPPTWVPRTEEKMTTVGCSLGQDATAWTTKILNPTVRGLAGNPSYEAIECKSAPKQGRSGGGLYTKDRFVAGVCDFAEPRGDVGLYATPRSIYSILDRNGMTALYKPGTSLGGPVLARNPSRSGSNTSRAIVRTQSPEPQDEITIPVPERLGINPPSVAQNQTRSTAVGHGWISPKSLPAEDGEAEST